MTSRVLFAGVRIESVNLISGGPSDQGGGNDGAWSDSCLQFGNTDTVSMPCFAVGGTPTSAPDGSKFYFHAFMGCRDVWPSVTFRDAAGKPWVLWANTNNEGEQQFYGNTGTADTPVWTPVGSPEHFQGDAFGNWDVEISINSGGLHGLRLFHNNNLIPTMVGTFANAGFTNIGDCVFACPNRFTTIYLSEVIMSENLPTIGAHVKTCRATGAGNYSEWTGAYTDVNEVGDSDTTINQSDTVGQKQSYPMGDVATPAGYVLRSIFYALRAKESGVAPTGVKAILRTGGTDYLSPALPSLDLGYNGVPWRWDIDPSTGVAWTDAGFNAVELGYESET
jgi:hypothetical protein